MTNITAAEFESTPRGRHAADCSEADWFFSAAVEKPTSPLRIYALVDAIYQTVESGRELGLGFLGLTAFSTLESELEERTHLHRFALVKEDPDTDLGVVLSEQLRTYEVYDRVRAQLIHDEARRVL